MSMYDDPRMKAQPDADSERWRCSWNDHGERCHFPGPMSADTRGGGRYFCRFHFFCGEGVKGGQIVEASRGYQRGTIPVVTEALVARFPEYAPKEWIAEEDEETVSGG